MDYNYKSLSEVLSEYKLIHVPYYQREYVWGKRNNVRNLDKFIDDIFSKYDEDSNAPYFIGTLAFCSENKERWYDVIDGQQRITSLILILSSLASIKCSDSIAQNHVKLLFPFGDERFVIQEEHSLTKELMISLGYDVPNQAQTYTADFDATLMRIRNIINGQWGGHDVAWYDNLYHYLLDKVVFIRLEYETISDSLKYFLNINSLSIPLTQTDIFYSILSESIRICGCSIKSIYEIKNDISKISETYPGLNKDIDSYNKAHYMSDNKGANNIIYIFINAYYGDDNHIDQLDDAGVGKWMSVYKNDVFKNVEKATKFVSNFTSYLKDLEMICRFIENVDACITDKSDSVYTASILIKYNKYAILLKFLTILFSMRHNYRNVDQNLYVSSNMKEIDYEKLSEIAKRLNLTLFGNYVKNSKSLVNGLEDALRIDQNGQYLKTIDEIVNDITLDNIFNLEYNDGGLDRSNKTNRNDSEYIKFILSCQEAYLNSVASRQNSAKDLNVYLDDLLNSDKFAVEHMYCRNEYNKEDRRILWESLYPDRFDSEVTFENERFKFVNLSLLDKKTNSSANDCAMGEKLKKYKNAKSVCENEPEYLIQSLAPDSDFYSNPFIADLHLPNRAITVKQQVCWEHSENNIDFNLILLKYALDDIANKH